MSFIGIVSDIKSFENLKERIKDIDKNNVINLIHVNRKSIENIKNIKFETIVIENELNKLEDYMFTLEKICCDSKYILLNTDINTDISILKKQKKNIITYGLNQKSTVTISSISENNILIYLQRSIKNKNDKWLDVEEKKIKLRENKQCKVYEIMIIYILLMIYDDCIIDEI